jgi:uncharacterized protein DUF4231
MVRSMLSKRTEPLVTQAKLESVVDGVKADESKDLDPSQKLYLKRRWAEMVMWWHSRSVKARWKYFLLRAILVVGGVLIPVLSTFSMLQGWHQGATILIAVVGAIVAGAAAWEGVANYGETWREKRRAAELLKVEGWLFLQLSGKYQSDKNYEVAFPHFVAEVETMVGTEVGEYLKVFDPSLAQTRKASEELINAIVEEAKKRIAKP